MVELLAPAGSLESVEAAVQSGADAIYLGYGDFNARRNAKNFTLEELEQAVDYCHVRDVSVFLTLNTLLTQRELEKASDMIGQVAKIGIDAVIVQDLGVADMVRQVAPTIERHASTQTTVHSLDGILQMEQMGFSRVVLARELSKREIEYLAGKSPLELEVFVHGAQCMSYSGQCFLSAMVGQRSGNRGLCAQPCRLGYQWEGTSASGGGNTGTPWDRTKQTSKQGNLGNQGKHGNKISKNSSKPQSHGSKPSERSPNRSKNQAEKHPMSLKDMALIEEIGDLASFGVKSFKIEGRMKRPEYVAIVTKIYSQVLKEGRKPTKEEMIALETAFSREGFTKGYYKENLGSQMFGIRLEEKEPKELFKEARRSFEKKEEKKVQIFYDVTVTSEKLTLSLEDTKGNRVSGAILEIESAQNKPLTPEAVQSQLQRTGGTPYTLEENTCQIAPNLALPLSKLNWLRRDLLEEVTVLRQKQAKDKETHSFHPVVVPKEKRVEPLVYTVWVEREEQITSALLDRKPAVVYLPLPVSDATLERHQDYIEAGGQWAISLPTILSDEEKEALTPRLRTLQEKGVATALAGSFDTVHWAKGLGFSVRGDYGLGIYNNQSLLQWQTSPKDRGEMVSMTPSFELKFPQIRDLDKTLPLEILVYGHLTLMTTKNCMISNETQKENKKTDCKSCSKSCKEVPKLVDRKGEHFPVVGEFGGRNVVRNGKPLYLADKQEDYKSLGLWAGRLVFTSETPSQCVEIVTAYEQGAEGTPSSFTRGLYYRGVE